MFKRIKAPKYKVGKFMLNEYELRYLMYQIANGEISNYEKLTVKDELGNTATFDEYGKTSCSLKGLDMIDTFVLDQYKAMRKNMLKMRL